MWSLRYGARNPCVSKQCPADGVWRIGRGGSPDRILKTRFTPSESSAGHGLAPQRAPKQCPANGVRKVLWGFVSRHGLLDTVKKHMANASPKGMVKWALRSGCLNSRWRWSSSRDCVPVKPNLGEGSSLHQKQQIAAIARPRRGVLQGIPAGHTRQQARPQTLWLQHASLK